MHRAEKKFAVLQKKIKQSKAGVNLQQIEILRKLCDGEAKKSRFGVVFWGLLLLSFLVVFVVIKHQTSAVSKNAVTTSLVIQSNFSVY